MLYSMVSFGIYVSYSFLLFFKSRFLSRKPCNLRLTTIKYINRLHINYKCNSIGLRLLCEIYFMLLQPSAIASVYSIMRLNTKQASTIARSHATDSQLQLILLEATAIGIRLNHASWLGSLRCPAAHGSVTRR